MKVVDANVIIHGRGLEEKALITPDVKAELKTDSSKIRSLALDIETVQPSEKSMKKVKTKADAICSKASEADQSLIALAIDKDLAVVTDDKELQNLAHHLNVDVGGFLDKVTSRKVSWVMKCPSCGKQMDSVCEYCGVSPVRKRDQYSSV